MGCAVMDNRRTSPIEMHSQKIPLWKRVQTQKNLITQPEQKVPPGPDFASFGSKFRPLWVCQHMVF